MFLAILNTIRCPHLVPLVYGGDGRHPVALHAGHLELLELLDLEEAVEDAAVVLKHKKTFTIFPQII